MSEAIRKEKATVSTAAKSGTKSRADASKGESAAGAKKRASAEKGAAKAATGTKTGMKTTASKPTKAKAKAKASAASAAKKAAPAKSAANKAANRPTARRTSAKGVASNPVGEAANRRGSARRAGVARRSTASVSAARACRRDADLFMEAAAPAKTSGKRGGRPPRKGGALFGALNACLAVGIAVLIAVGVHTQGQYAAFAEMRDAVDRQTFYEGTTIEGVDVSKMTLQNAMDYWRDRVEPRYADRTVTLENGATVTARELGYTSDYEAVLSAAWSAGRSGSLEQRYRALSGRRENPVAYSITRSDYSDAIVSQYVQLVAERTDRPAVDAAIASFDADTYEFQFTESQKGVVLDQEAVKRDIESAIAAGGGSVALTARTIEPQITTEEVASKYGLIDYAITNANSSSKARINNIALAMSFINGTRVGPGETFSFNEAVGERTAARGFKKAPAFSAGDVTEQIGGGICQVSTTLFNAAVKADMEIVERHNHSLTVSYVDKGKDATVDWGHQDFRFKNTSEDDIYICCYLTDDKRVRFGIFGRLLPNGESITVDAVTTEVVKYETEYQATPLLGKGQTYLMQAGRNGYKAEAYKVRWDAAGNQISRELLCKSYYQVKNEIIQYGA